VWHRAADMVRVLLLLLGLAALGPGPAGAAAPTDVVRVGQGWSGGRGREGQRREGQLTGDG
jgi:hypothetical protein